MLRVVLLALLFANLAFFGYARLIGEPARLAALPPAGPEIPRLLLAGEAGTTADGRRCVSVGPFVDAAAADAALTELQAGGAAVLPTTREQPLGTSYWVLVEAPDLQQAERVALRLRAAGVEDVEIVPPAAEATRTVVSLGVYSNRDRAERRAAELRGYAVVPAIEERERNVSRWWLDVERDPADPPLDVAALEAIVPGARELVLQPCPARPQA